MDLTYNDDQQALADSVRAFVAREWPIERVRDMQTHSTGFDDQLWKNLTALGWSAVAVPEEHEGLGGGLVEQLVVLEELGRGAVDSPLRTSIAYGAFGLLRGHNDSARARHLPAVAVGESIVTAAVLESDGRSAWPAVTSDETEHSADHPRLRTTKTLVPYAASADHFVVTARLVDMGDVVLLIPADRAGIRMRRQEVPVGEPRYRVDFDGVEVRREDVLAAGDAAHELFTTCAEVDTILTAAYTVGLCQSALTLTVDHAKSRVQFGRPLGAFQTVAHRCADMHTEINATRLMVFEAAWLLDQSFDARLASAAAKAQVDQTVQLVSANSHQVLGAMGFSTEHDLHLFTRRAKAYEQTGGGLDRHLHRVADLLGL